MPIVTSFFLVLSLVMAVVFGPQTRPWSWGPAMIALALSTLSALPAFWRREKHSPDWMVLTLGALTAAWFAWRAIHSPVAELGMSDLLLLGGAVGSFISVRGISGNVAAEKTLIWGIAIFQGVFLWAVAKQWAEPSFHPLFGLRAAENSITGFFSHYNDAANYLLAVSLILAAAGLMGRHGAFARVVFFLLAAAGFAGVFMTKSRGGILGAAVGIGVLAVASLVLAKRRNSRWFAPAVVAVPLIGAGVAAFLFMGWEQRSGGDTHKLLDNDIRLYLLGVAVSCITEHPFQGGGSGSFSWECNRFFEMDVQRHAGDRPDTAHNEFIQSATDYGVIGAGLLAALLCALAIAAVLRMIFEDRPRELDERDAWRLGGVSALAGLFVQSSFSSVFHVMPGVILLGVTLGMLSRPEMPARAGNGLVGRLLLTAAALGCAVLLLPPGWKGTQITAILWPTYFAKQPETSPEARIDALAKAIRIWPQSEFFHDRALIYQKQLIEREGKPGFRELAELAAADYAEGTRLHAFDANLFVNLANLLSLLGRDDEAEQAFLRAIHLQGGMEPTYRAHFSLAKHHLQKATRHLEADDSKAAEAQLLLAAQEMETAVAKMHWVGPDFHEPRLFIHESLGIVREIHGDREAALASYNFAAELRDGRRAHYRAALLIGKMALESWSKRQPSEALTKFIEARKRMDLAQIYLPAGVTEENRKEYIAFLDDRIAFLKGAKVVPAE